MLLFRRDSKEIQKRFKRDSNDVPTPRLIDYMFIYFEFERVKMFYCWFIGKNSDRKREFQKLILLYGNERFR